MSDRHWALRIDFSQARFFKSSGNFAMFAAIRPRRIAQRPPPLPDEREGKGCGSGQREIAKQQKSDQSR